MYLDAWERSEYLERKVHAINRISHLMLGVSCSRQWLLFYSLEDGRT